MSTIKVIEAINTMAQNANKIENVTLHGDSEYYFSYKSYRWSIFYSKGGDFDQDAIYLHYYPGEGSLEEVIGLSSSPIVSYSTNDFKTKEAFESFHALYQAVKEKVFGTDKMFDDIINDSPF